MWCRIFITWQVQLFFDYISLLKKIFYYFSNRDLSIILDALLKTKSRTVLIDIINKNGAYLSLGDILLPFRQNKLIYLLDPLFA